MIWRQPNSPQKLSRPALWLGASAPCGLRLHVSIRYALGTGRAAYVWSVGLTTVE